MKKITKITVVFVILLVAMAMCVSADSTYSTKDDPLVSLSYVEDVLAPQIVQQVMDKVEAEYVPISDISKMSSGSYTYLTLNKGQTLMASSCLEVVIVDGESKAVITSASVIKAEGGISDLTSGTIITNGEKLTESHYLVIPKGDGRGLAVTSGTVNLLVRGEYNITG